MINKRMEIYPSVDFNCCLCVFSSTEAGAAKEEKPKKGENY